MEILSHRGYWLHPDERNSEVALRRSFDLGFGTETDLRDQNGEVVVAHDPPTGPAMPFRRLLDIMDGRNLRLALNIKSDGLAVQINETLAAYRHSNYFTFDMSLPEQVRHLRAGLIVFTGMSDLQNHPPLFAESAGVWLDSFAGDWFESDIVDGLIESAKEVCIVSSELHQRDPATQWTRLKSAKYLADQRLLLCTDRPQDAQVFFGL